MRVLNLFSTLEDIIRIG